MRDRDWVVVTGGAVILIGCFAVWQASSAFELKRMKRTMADMRIIATAVEHYSEAMTRYPQASSIEQLERAVSPRFISALPKRDGWGHPFLVTSGGVDEYRIVSTGGDGRLDASVAGWMRTPLGTDSVPTISGERLHPAVETLIDEQRRGATYPELPNLGARDLVFRSGSFIRSPELSSIGDNPFPPSPSARIATRWIAALTLVALAIYATRVLLTMPRRV